MKKYLYLLALPLLLLAMQVQAAENTVVDVLHNVNSDNQVTFTGILGAGADCMVGLSTEVALPSDELTMVSGSIAGEADGDNQRWEGLSNPLKPETYYYYRLDCNNASGDFSSGIYSFVTGVDPNPASSETGASSEPEVVREVDNSGLFAPSEPVLNFEQPAFEPRVAPTVEPIEAGVSPEPILFRPEVEDEVLLSDSVNAIPRIAPRPTLINDATSATNPELGADTRRVVRDGSDRDLFDTEEGPKCPYVKGQNTNVFTNDLKVTILDDADPLYIHTDLKAPVLLYKADFAGKKGVKVHVNECKADEGTELVTFYGKFDDVVSNDVKASLVLVATERQSANKEFYSCAATTLKAGESSFQVTCDVTGFTVQMIKEGKLCDGTATECSYEVVPHMEVGDFFNQSASFQNTTAAYFAGGFKGAGNFSLLKQRTLNEDASASASDNTSSNDDGTVSSAREVVNLNDTVELPKQPKKSQPAVAAPAREVVSAKNPNVEEALLNENAVNPKVDRDFARRQNGKLFLQVQDRGRVWYTDPSSSKRYEVTFKNALPLFQKLAHGITTENLNKIRYGSKGLSEALDSDNDGYSDKSEAENGYNPYGVGRYAIDENLSERMKGKLLLQTDNGGRIWYVDMEGEKYEVTWGNLMTLFQSLAVGITDDNLEKIEAGLVE